MPSVRPGRRWRGSNPRQKGPCRSQGGLTSHCATDAPRFKYRKINLNAVVTMNHAGTLASFSPLLGGGASGWWARRRYERAILETEEAVSEDDEI
ncbi:hypothetical protein PoB_003860100 [Plakobranchus ocellatus]|uniref:Uncharacterized protein n=1 Tax=Plakobranchus ocellatus TaxID=259542 RepID=A0AAV4AVD7_9GAST|nr:hypothetical protein PoB_003860100 [Plakobranchus ocellatus]